MNSTQMSVSTENMTKNMVKKAILSKYNLNAKSFQTVPYNVKVNGLDVYALQFQPSKAGIIPVVPKLQHFDDDMFDYLECEFCRINGWLFE